MLTAFGAVARQWLPPAAQQPPLLLTDAIAFALSVLPVWVYLTATEAGPHQATWGKRRTHLRVVGADGELRPRLLQVVIRNGVKLLPWQLAHVSVARVIVGADAPATIALTYALAVLIPVVSIVLAWRSPGQRALHDHVAGTLVVRA